MSARLMDGRFSEGFNTLELLARVENFDDRLAAAIRSQNGAGAEVAVEAMRDALLGGTNRQFLDLVEERMTPDERAKLLAHPEVIDGMFAAMRQHTLFQLIQGYFNKPADQLARVNELRHERGWGILDVWLIEAEKSVPTWPKGQLQIVQLVPYLDDVKKGPKGYLRTFHELWQVAAKQQHANWRWDGYDKANPEKLRLLKGIEHKPGLRWEVIDLGCNRNEKPMDVRNPDLSPHAGILAAAALHPEWIKAMDGVNVPYVFVPGYEVSVSDEDSWQDVPRVHFNRGDRGIELHYDWYGIDYSYWAVPSFVRE